MQTTTERPARSAGATARQLAAQHLRAAKARQQVRKLRAIASAEIERLIAFMDETDGYTMDEREPALGFPETSEYWHHNRWLGWQHREECLDQTRHAGSLDDREADDGEMEDDDSDDEPDADDEPSLGSVEGPADSRLGPRCMGRQEHWAQGDVGDREVEDEYDEEGGDREGDELLHGGDEHDGSEPDADGEPSLGWSENICQTVPNTSLERHDFEMDASYVSDVSRQRYKPFDRFSANGNRDGRHVNTEQGCAYATRRLTNLSEKQRAAVSPRLNRDEVRL